MKVFILSLPLHTNIGGVLQTYALQKTLMNLGYEETYVIKRNLYGSSIKSLFLRLRDFLSESFLRCVKIQEKSILKHFTGDLFAQSFYVRRFRHLYIKEIYINNLRKYHWDDNDAIVVGSDQVWRLNFFHPILDAYLQFVGLSKIKRIAYGVSFGNSSIGYNNDLIEKCKSQLKNFSFISVRESSSISVFKKVFCMQPKLVLDPTMLLDVDEYKKLVSKMSIPNKQFVFSYILDSCKQISEILDAVCANFHLENLNLDNDNFIKPSIESFLYYFQYSEYIVTDSFHGTVFSILFHKNFVVLANYDRGIDRLISLLDLFGLSNHLIEHSEKNKAIRILEHDIDWIKIDSILEEMRVVSIMSLKDSLK